MDRCNANIEQGKANVTSLVERRSCYTFVMRNANRNSAGAIAGIESKLSALPSALRQIITFDRGTEVAACPHLREKLGVESFGEPVAERRACNACTGYENFQTNLTALPVSSTRKSRSNAATGAPRRSSSLEAQLLKRDLLCGIRALSLM